MPNCLIARSLAVIAPGASGRLAGQLRTQLTGAEARRAEVAPHPDSMDFYFRGRACLTKGISAEHATLARGYFESALVRDPGNIDALVGVAQTDVISGTSHLAEGRIARLAAATCKFIPTV